MALSCKWNDGWLSDVALFLSGDYLSYPESDLPWGDVSVVNGLIFESVYL